MSAIIECITNPNCEMIEECESKIDCTVAMEASEGLTRYICGRIPCKYSNKSNCNTTNCNLTTCRYNENGKCTNEEKRKECVEVAEKVLVDRLSRFEDDGK